MLRPALSACLTILFCAAGSIEAQSPATRPPLAAPSPNEPLDVLSPADLQKALDFIKKNYVVPAALDDPAIDRATLAGLLERLGRGVTLTPAKANAASTPAPFYHEIIGDHIGYVRPGALRKSDLAELDDALKSFAAKKVDALIVDLRATAASADFAMAAEFAQRFVPGDGELFAMRGPAAGQDRTFTSEGSPVYSGFLSVLIDEETSGAPEVLASVLRARDRAILIGQTTAGAAVKYSELPLPDGMVLRVAVAEAVLPKHGAGFPQGVQPDLPVTMPPDVKREIFAQSLTKGMAAFVFEEDRPHLNEAALLAGTNPEIEAMQDRQQRRARGDKAPLHDAVTQRAVDVITSIGVYARQPGRPP